MKNYHYIDYMLAERRKDELKACERERFIKANQAAQDKEESKKQPRSISTLLGKFKMRQANENV